MTSHRRPRSTFAHVGGWTIEKQAPQNAPGAGLAAALARFGTSLAVAWPSIR